MYIQENLTTTPYEIPGISWELPAELEEKFNQYGAFVKLVFNEDKTAVIDIAENTERRAEFEAEQAQKAEEDASRMQELRKQALEAQGVTAMARMLFRSQAAAMTADDVIRCRGLAEEWEPGAYAEDAVRVYNGVPYRCCQPHDSTPNPDWNPEAAPALWSAYHGTSAETALPWKAPTGAHDLYRQGEVMEWTDGRRMKALQDTNFSPEEYPTAWKEA